MSGFLEPGGGKVAFVPTGSHSPPAGPPFFGPSFGGITEYRADGVAGIGIHLHLANSFGLRAEYRGLLYKSPQFGEPELTTVSSEPTLSLTYSFGHR